MQVLEAPEWMLDVFGAAGLELGVFPGSAEEAAGGRQENPGEGLVAALQPALAELVRAAEVLAAEPCLPARHRRRAELFVETMRSWQQAAEDLATAERLRASASAASLRPVDLAAEARQAVADSTGWAIAQGLEVKLVGRQAGPSLRSDAGLLRRLLHHALRWAAAGGRSTVTVSLRGDGLAVRGEDGPPAEAMPAAARAHLAVLRLIAAALGLEVAVRQEPALAELDLHLPARGLAALPGARPGAWASWS